MNVLLIGNRSREHAIARALAVHSIVNNVFVVPGNVGIAQEYSVVPIEASDTESLLSFAKRENIHLVVIADETLLSLGLIDFFEGHGIETFGPKRSATCLESSKSYAKTLLKSSGLAVENWTAISDSKEALNVFRRWKPPWVIKTDGLAGGKGVLITNDLAEAHDALSHRFESGETTQLLCEFIDGNELTLSCVIRNSRVVGYWRIKDYKRLLIGDRGPLTASMGAVVDRFPNIELFKDAVEQLVMSVGFDTGILELDMIQRKHDGRYFVTEANVNAGMPATEALVSADPNFLANLVLGQENSQAEPGCYGIACVVASPGYPKSLKHGIVKATKRDLDIDFFWGCVETIKDGLGTGRGRIATLSCGRKAPKDAKEALALALAQLSNDQCHFRTDIGSWPPRTRIPT